MWLCVIVATVIILYVDMRIYLKKRFDLGTAEKLYEY